jgi:broad specificity phosphatase PhoE/ribonuclease HI
VTRVIVEADGGSRGNPGPAAFGAVLRDADSGVVIASTAEVIGIATNNVAEYRGLIAGLGLANEHAPDAELEVRMDSKLVIEQMAGRWKIKHPDMKPLAQEAQEAVGARVVVWTWIPREQNGTADALLNAALDGKPLEAPTGSSPAESTSSASGWSARFTTVPTTFILIRHGVTPNTERKLFCGSGGTDPGLTDTGRDQAQRAADWVRRNEAVDAIYASPLRRTQETAGAVADALGLEVVLEPGVAEVAFGDWDGRTFKEIFEQWPNEMQSWLDSPAVPPPNGESMEATRARTLAARDRLVAAHPEQTVVVVSHVTPIKLLVAEALGAPLEAIYRMDLAPASITSLQWWPDGGASMRNFSFVP